MIDQLSLQNYIDNRQRLNMREQEVLSMLKDIGGEATSWDLLNCFGWTNPNMVRPRLTGLMNKGYIFKKCHKKVDGINQWVWCVIK